MVSGDRPNAPAHLGAAHPADAGSTDDVSASFPVGTLRIDMVAAPGSARVVATLGNEREVWVVEPDALDAWARQTAALLTLSPAQSADGHVSFRAPFLVDREARPSLALEARVDEREVAYRVLITGASGRVAGFPTDLGTVRGMVEAASGASTIARAPRSA